MQAQDSTAFHFRFKFNGRALKITRQDSVDYGMFVLARTSPPLTTLSQRISRVDSFGLHWFRLNYSYTGGSSLSNLKGNIIQIHAAGLKVELTYNETPLLTQGGTGLFNTDTTTMGRHLDSVFSVTPPDMVVCYNEPSTKNYFTDTSINYIPAMLCMIYHAHKYGIKVSANTTTQTGAYALLAYYLRNGKTDSAALVQTWSGIHDTTGIVAQHAINYFFTITSAVRISAADYSDVHCYLPFGINKMDTSYNPMFITFINFIANQTGKPITMTEFGTDNHSQWQLDHMLGDMLFLKIWLQVYYDGDNSGDAVNLSGSYDTYYKTQTQQN
jgi:hypothetical protein